MDVYRNLIGTLLAHSSSTPPIIMASSQANAEIGIGYCPTITAAAGMAGNNQPILFDNHGPDTRYSGPVKVAQTITSALDGRQQYAACCSWRTLLHRRKCHQPSG